MAFNKAKALATADKHIAKQNYNKALNELLKVAKVSPGDTNLLNKIGDLYSKTNNSSNAISYFFKVADSYKKSGFNLKAIAVYKKILRIDPGHLDARDHLVELYLQQGHQSEAKGELRRMAEHYYSENLFSRALTCYEKMLEIDPNNLDSRLKISEILVREGRRDEASQHFCSMGKELLQKNLIHEAQKMVSQGLKMAPDSPELQILMARVHLAEGKAEEALHQLTETCRKNDRNLEAIKILGQTYMDRDQLREARACYLRALHIEETETHLLEEVARKFIEAGELDEAHGCLVPISEVFLKKGDVDESVRLFRNILYADENHLLSLETLVQIYEQNDQMANAILTIEKMIAALTNKGETEAAKSKIHDLLRLDPNNLEWRARLESLESGGLPQAEEVPQPVDISSADNSFHLTSETGISMEADPAEDFMQEGDDLSLEPSDTQTRIQNHLTEAEVFMKYGIMDQALSHLNEVKEIEPFNIAANTKLKQIYQERNETDNVIQCTVGLINGYIESKEYHDALDQVKELEAARPDIARIHKGRIESLLYQQDAQEREERDQSMSQYSLDFSSSGSYQESRGLDFQNEEEPDVVDFRELSTSPENQPEPVGAADGWALDMPGSADDGPKAQDLAEMYATQVEQPGDITMDNISSFDFPPQDDADQEPAFTPAGSISEDDIHFQDQVTGITDIDQLEQSEDLEEADLLDESALEEASLLDESALEEASLLDDSEIIPEAELIEEPEPEPEPAPAPAPAVENAHAPLESQDRSLASELEEIDFFISVEAFEDASNLLKEAHNRFGDHPLIMERMQEVAAHTSRDGSHGLAISKTSTTSEAPTHNLLDKDTGFFDLAAELSEELFDDSGEINDKTGQEEIQSVEELFEEFKKGVDEQISEDDFETHYDLGIAYKEMGLLEEAINEFRRAEKDRGRYLECATLIGNCLIELGRTEDSIEHFEHAITANSLTDEERIALEYECALAYQGLGELEKALALFMKIKEVESNYRDLESRIEALV
ncbi:Tetratricopeptide repeat protein [Sulfidibacter corallicola]|uniref:Tetratricopeptide repeat protein n=1 Tax=Sulfidibacter corallicola TaxID=2818388 RepID=A0A8A4TVK5_SULCO|nr:tetratricopeptide repeat protein [Sulfidibacter corallicola]QTD53969.1 tetratricopeptide repeat protein [Sulfidibacter corallicola]